MTTKTLQIIENELINEKILAESNIEHYLMDVNLSPEDKKTKILNELDKLKDASLKLNYWESFIENNIVINNAINPE
jgi:hypothetical protein